MSARYLDPTPEAGAALFRRDFAGEVVMLSLLRLREVADYSENPELAGPEPVSGREAYQRYIDHTLPFLRATGGDLVLLGEGGHYLVGPSDERWDLVMLVRQRSLADFLAFASNEAYLAGIGHRTAALADCRMLPIEELTGPKAATGSAAGPRCSSRGRPSRSRALTRTTLPTVAVLALVRKFASVIARSRLAPSLGGSR